MAYGNVVGYQPIQGAPDAYRFQMADGQSATFFGQNAADLKARVDAADAATNSGMLAQNMSVDPSASGAGGMSEATDAGGASPPPPAPAPPVTPPQTLPPGGMSVAPPSPDQTMSVQPAQTMSPNPGPAPAPNPNAGTSPYTMGGVNVGLRQGAGGQLQEYSPGSAGSKGGLALRTQSQSGGFDPSQQYVDQMDELHQTRQAANEVAMGAAQKQAEMQRSYLDEQLRQNSIDQQEAARRQDQIAVGVQSLQAKYDKASKDYGSSAPPQDNRGVGERIAGAIAMGMGAFGAAMTHSPNFAMELINRSIDRDIHAQETAIAVKKDKANNALGDLQRQMGSLELARAATRGIRLQQAKTQYDRIAATTGDEQVRANALNISAKLDEEHATQMEDYRLKAIGQVTKSFVNTPRIAPTAAGWHNVGTKAAINIVKEGAGLDAQNAGTAKTLASVGKGGASGATKQAQLASNDAALAALSEYDKLLAEGGDSGVLNTGIGGSDRSKKLGVAAQAMAPVLGRALEGNAANADTMTMIRNNLVSADGEKMKFAVGQYKQMLTNQRKAIEGGADYSGQQPQAVPAEE